MKQSIIISEAQIEFKTPIIFFENSRLQSEGNRKHDEYIKTHPKLTILCSNCNREFNVRKKEKLNFNICCPFCSSEIEVKHS